jgi:hypothetical protein
MIGPLPRLHRWVLFVVCAVGGAVLGAWVSGLAVAQSDYVCGEILLGVCIAPTVNLLPIIAGTALGLIAALILLYDPHDPDRTVAVDDEQPPGGAPAQQ